MLEILIFFAGLVGLWIGAEFIIHGSLGLARRFGLSESFIGLVILSLGTDLPEIMVSISGAREQLIHGTDVSGIVVGNIIGSNMSQMIFVLAAVGLLGGTIKINRKAAWFQGLALVSATLLFFVLAADGLIDRADGLMFLMAYVIYFVAISRNQPRTKPKKKTKQHSPWKLVGMLMIGIVLLGEASSRVITSGIDIATNLGVSQVIVGAVLVGIGTSLPELVVSIKASFKGATGLSIGNLVGSNIVDILLALGGSAVISSWKIDRHVAQFDLPFLLFSMVVATLFMVTRDKLERSESFLLISLYVVYVALKLMGW